MAAVLLGPPEIYKNSSAADVATSPETTTTVEPQKHVSPTSSDDPSMDSLVAFFDSVGLFQPNTIPLMPYNAIDLAPPASSPLALSGSLFSPNVHPLMGFTENNSATFLSSGEPCLDFFFQVVPGTSSEILVSLLEASWKKDSLTALKLVCNLRGVRGTGKSDKEGFYTAALWLHQHHPKTLAFNVRSIAEFGYLKDLLEILHRLLQGADVRKIIKEERENIFLARRIGKKVARSRRTMPYYMVHRIRGGRRKKENKEKKAKEQKWKSEEMREEVIVLEKERAKIRMKKASILRKKKRVELARKALDRYHKDKDFQFLHDQIAGFFAELLISDLDLLKSGRGTRKISLAAKWCPSIDSSFDKSTLICESIARRVFPRDRYPEYDEVEEQHYTYRVRDRLRKEVLVPLRKILELPEVYMSANKWNFLPYNRVTSVAMKNYKNLFENHDNERFLEYLQQVSDGTTKISAGALLPHEILVAACQEKEDKVAELQWQRMVNDLSVKGKLKNCIAICDVSGSMEGKPMEVCLALGLLTSELSEEPWKGKVITFSNEPELHLITGDTLKEKASFVKQMDWGVNTDLRKVFSRILQIAVKGKLPPEKMIKRVFVFSDMEFDQASTNSWETDYKVIKKKFKKRKYGSVVPEIVFWNLRDSRSIPVPSKQRRVALVSGYSKNLMTLFLQGDGIISPLEVMKSAIAADEYQMLKVFD